MLAGCDGPLGARRAVIVTPVADMHSRQSRNADVVSQARLGQTVEILQKREGWWRIRTPDNYEGYVRTEALRVLKGDAAYPAAGRASVVVTSLRAHIYRDASVTRHAPLYSAPYESRLEVVREEDERWVLVRMPSGREAWIQKGDTAPALDTLDVPQLAEHARRFLGLPYTWGGTSALGYDCSGFTQMLCRRGGIEIPRDAKPQAHWDGMQPVERTALEPGDLLYFGPSFEKINHTGFYLGNGEFIHSTTNTQPVVQVSRLADEPWTRIYVCARRWKRS